jgi:hypothetical protein
MATRTYQLEIQGTLFASYRETVLHFSSPDTNDNDTLAAGESLCSAFNTSALAQFLATLPGNYSVTRLAARRVQLKPSATACRYYGIGTQPGTRGTDGTGQQTCPSIFLVPTMGTKSGGRIFWPTIPQADLVQGAPATAWQTAVNTCLATLIAGITAASMTWTLVVYSRKLGISSNITSHSFSPVVGFIGKRRKPVGAV